MTLPAPAKSQPWILLCLVVPWAWGCGGAAASADGQEQWWRGNLHTHSLWSDGDDYPEMIIEWYKSRGYDFLALSDHNIIQEGEKWVDVTDRPDGEAAHRKYLERFGEEWVEEKMEDGKRMVRLKTLDEYRPLFEEPGEFLLIKSEEITDRFEDKPIHVNATNIAEVIPPQGGNSVAEVMQNNMDAVQAQRDRTGQPMFPHLNHPNFGWAVTVEDLLALERERFFEVYNGHPAVHNTGDEHHPGTERMWDIVLAERVSRGDPPMYGIAVDDSHSYHELQANNANPGRGWVMVRAASLTPEGLIEAMESGDFYGSTGVVVADVHADDEGMTIRIQPEEGVTYRTQFIGTMEGYPSAVAVEGEHAHADDGTDTSPPIALRRYSEEIGNVLAEVEGVSPSYMFRGGELYVRAKIISSKRKENPIEEMGDEREAAWVQPVLPTHER